MPKVNIRTTDIKNKLKGHRGVLIQMSELVLKLGLTMVGLIRFFTAKYRVMLFHRKMSRVRTTIKFLQCKKVPEHFSVL